MFGILQKNKKQKTKKVGCGPARFVGISAGNEEVAFICDRKSHWAKVSDCLGGKNGREGHLGHYCSVGRVQSSHGGNSGETSRGGFCRKGSPDLQPSDVMIRISVCAHKSRDAISAV